MNRKGFTLIELLVVVGILSVLAAIAVPNFMDAMVKSRVAQAKIDLRTLAQALDQYRIDHRVYPRKDTNLQFFAQYLLPELTSPIAYLNPANVKDPFGAVEEYEEPPRLEAEDMVFGNEPLAKNSYTYTPYVSFSRFMGNPAYRREGFSVASIGPDKQDSYIVDYPFPEQYRFPGDTVRDSVYNPSNGIHSLGDIGYFGGELPVGGLVGG